jgi:hypothetical protein
MTWQSATRDGFRGGLRASIRPLRAFGTMRDREIIDSELRLLAAVRRVCREHAGVLPSSGR